MSLSVPLPDCYRAPEALDDPKKENVVTTIRVTAGQFVFGGRLEKDLSPETCAAFEKHMPFSSKAIHVRWSGAAIWLPLGDLDFGIGYENNTCYPSPGQMILYPGGVSETEILLSYGGVNFGSKAGQLSGNSGLIPPSYQCTSTSGNLILPTLPLSGKVNLAD